MTTPPPLDEQLAAHARERRRQDELLEALAAGTLTASERAELDTFAATDADLRATIELCHPLDASRRDKIVEQLVAPSNVVPLRPRAMRRWVVGGLALAAGLSVAVCLPSLRREPAVVAYSLEASGDAELRGTAQPAVPKVSPASRLTLVARPAHSTPPPTVVRVHVAPAATRQFRELDAAAERSPDGAVRIEVAGASLGAAGPVVVKVTLGEGGHQTILETPVDLTP